MYREFQKLFERSLRLNTPSQGAVAAGVTLQFRVQDLPPEQINTLLRLAEHVQRKYAQVDIAHSQTLDADFWHTVLERLSRQDVPYAKGRVAFRTLEILRNLAKRRGSCLIDKLHRVVGTLHKEFSTTSTPPSRLILTRMKDVLELGLENEESTERTRKYYAPILERIQSELETHSKKKR